MKDEKFLCTEQRENYCSELSTEGSVAFDASINEEVIFMSIPLCFLGDSPMAAEITNTPHPGSSKNPCRMCELKCNQGEVKCSMSYIQSFFGHPALPPPIKWINTIKGTKDLWRSCKNDTIAEFERK
jgi:hypothetical protein